MILIIIIIIIITIIIITIITKKQKLEAQIFGLLQKITKKCYFYTDVNECQDQTHNCNINSRCNNTIGLYLCTCLQGYSGDGMECYGMVIDLKCSSFKIGLHFLVFKQGKFNLEGM